MWTTLLALAVAAPCPMEAHEASMRGFDLMIAGQNDEARAAFEQAIALCPEDPDPWMKLAWLARVEQDVELARQHVARALEIDPCHVEALRSTARGAEDADPAEAYALRVKAVACEPWSIGAWTDLKWHQKRHDGEIFWTVMNEGAWRPTPMPVWQAHLEQAAEAGFTTEAWLAHSPSDRDTYLHWRTENLDRMVAYLETLVAPSPHDPEK